MKNINKYILAASVLLSVSACQKDFDPKSYAPPLNIGGFTSTKQIATSNLIAHWSFDGNLTDSVSNTAGTAKSTTFSEGVKGQAMQGALNGYVLADAGTKVAGLTSFTTTMWVNTPKPTGTTIALLSLSKTNGFWGNIEIFFENGSTNDDGKLRVHLFNGTEDKTIEINGQKNLFDKWTNLGVSYNQNNDTCKVYLNGLSIFGGKVPGQTGPLKFSNVGKIVFGSPQFQTDPSQTSATGSQSWAGFLTGRLDEVRIYDKALTDNEVNALVLLEGRGK
jgi:hypothetical protein